MTRVPTAIALHLLLVPACWAPDRDVPVPPPPPHVEREHEFADPLALLRSIENETFATRAGLRDELEAWRSPPPVEVAFARGTQIEQDRLEALRDLVARLRTNPTLVVDLIGCSDPSGSRAVNVRVSHARAASVAAELRELGLPEEQIGSIDARGEDCEEQERVVHVVPVVRRAT